MKLDDRKSNMRATFATACFGLLVIAGESGAQSVERSTVEIKIWEGGAPGTNKWTGPEVDNVIDIPKIGKITLKTDVTNPTITVFCPVGRANGTATIVCRGGGFQVLAWDLEGVNVAKRLAQQGYTAFLVKYRVRNTGKFTLPKTTRATQADFNKFKTNLRVEEDIAVADVRRAVSLIRSRSAEFGINAKRVGVIGFSAGAIAAVDTALSDNKSARPDFVASIYGGIGKATVPVDAPPIFIAAAQDDDSVPITESVKMFDRWTSVGRDAEAHFYEQGGHGFGLSKRNLPVDSWANALFAWLKSHSLDRR